MGCYQQDWSVYPDVETVIYKEDLPESDWSVYTDVETVQNNLGIM